MGVRELLISDMQHFRTLFEFESNSPGAARTKFDIMKVIYAYTPDDVGDLCSGFRPACVSGLVSGYIDIGK